MSDSSFGVVYKANDVMANDYVAIKVVRIANDIEYSRDESDILRGCKSKYIVKYIDAIQKDNELWVSIGTISLNE